MSFALGAFFAGMVLRESELSHRAAHESLPLRDAFSVLFFVSVGMLFDPMVLVESPVPGAGGGGRHHVRQIDRRVRAGAGAALSAQHGADRLGQPGADRRILVHPRRRWACRSGCCRWKGQSLILAGAIISIALNPLLFKAIEPVQRWLRAQVATSRASWSARPIRWPSCR